MPAPLLYESDLNSGIVKKIKQKVTGKLAASMEEARRLVLNSRYRQAEDIYRRILRDHPLYSQACFGLAFALKEQGKSEEAVLYYRKTLSLNPANADAYYNLGSIFQHRRLPGEALSCYESAISADPGHAMAHNNMGSILQQIGRIDDAIAAYQKSLEQNPALVSAHNNLGLAFQEKGMFEEAMKCHREALSLNPEHATAHFNMGGLLLMRGALEKGWEEFEWRKKMPGYQSRGFSQPLWDGSDTTGRTILLYSEMGYDGFGDVIQFVRYAPLLKERGAKVIVECGDAIKRLLESMPEVEEVITKNSRLPRFDLHCPFLSLPFVFRTTLESIPSSVPYVAAENLLVQRWSETVRETGSRFNIGIVWSGDLRHPRVQYRSCPLDIFRPLSEINGVALYSLQKGEAATMARRAPEGLKIIDCADAITGFHDAAACMEVLDLIISVDTAAAHLAGALARPVWTLLPFLPEWRWMLARGDSPWYPTMRIFRQPTPGDWKSVLDSVADEIRKTVSDKETSPGI